MTRIRTTLTTALALSALTAGSAAAYAAAGDYAKKSAVYVEFIANCKTERNTRPDLRDEAARKLEKMSAAQRQLQINNCQGEERLAAERLAKQRQATNVPPAAIVGAGAAIGVAAVRTAGRRLTQEQRTQLNELRAVESEEVLGPRPANSKGYLGHKRGHQPVPRGCSEVKKLSEDGRTTYVRVTCR